MPTLTIRNLPQATRDALKARAALNGRSMEAEARRIIGESVSSAPDQTAFSEAVREVQEAFAAYRVPEVLLSEALIADRRLEAWTETVEMNDWLTAASAREQPALPATPEHAKSRS
jgi:plasmid stability protein